MIWNDVAPAELKNVPSVMLEVPEHSEIPPPSEKVTLNPSTGVVKSRRMLTGMVTHELDGQITVETEGAPTIAGSQPMSRNMGSVRSTVLWRSLLIAGSMSAFGVSEMSQCETDDPFTNGFGVYT